MYLGTALLIAGLVLLIAAGLDLPLRRTTPPQKYDRITLIAFGLACWIASRLVGIYLQ